jgi:hypothetical protein
MRSPKIEGRRSEVGTTTSDWRSSLIPRPRYPNSDIRPSIFDIRSSIFEIRNPLSGIPSLPATGFLPVQPTVLAAARQFRVRAGLHDAALLQHDDSIRELDE